MQGGHCQASNDESPTPLHSRILFYLNYVPATPSWILMQTAVGVWMCPCQDAQDRSCVSRGPAAGRGVTGLCQCGGQPGNIKLVQTFITGDITTTVQSYSCSIHIIDVHRLPMSGTPTLLMTKIGPTTTSTLCWITHWRPTMMMRTQSSTMRMMTGTLSLT